MTKDQTSQELTPLPVDPSVPTRTEQEYQELVKSIESLNSEIVRLNSEKGSEKEAKEKAQKDHQEFVDKLLEKLKPQSLDETGIISSIDVFLSQEDKINKVKREAEKDQKNLLEKNIKLQDENENIYRDLMDLKNRLKKYTTDMNATIAQNNQEIINLMNRVVNASKDYQHMKKDIQQTQKTNQLISLIKRVWPGG